MERTGALLSSKVPSERLGVLQSQEVLELCFLDAQLPLSVLSGHTRANQLGCRLGTPAHSTLPRWRSSLVTNQKALSLRHGPIAEVLSATGYLKMCALASAAGCACRGL